MTEENENGLPPGWADATIADLCDMNPRHPRDTDHAMEVSFVPMAAVSDTLGQITDPETRPFGEVRSGFTHFAEGDVLWAKITPCMENGKSAVARDLVNGIGCGTTEFHVLRSNGAVTPDWVHRYVRQTSYRRRARATMQSGVGQARVPKGFVLETRLPVPPLNEQRRIVARIDALQARSRRAREALDAVWALLDRFRQSVLAAAFRGDLTADWRAKQPPGSVEPASVLLERIRAERKARWVEAEAEKARGRAEEKARKAGKPWGPKDDAKAVAAARKKAEAKYTEPEPVDAEAAGLPELPEGWCWASLDEISSRVSVGHVGPTSQHYTDAGEGVTFLRSQNVRPGRLDLDGVRHITRSFHATLGKSTLQPGDLLIVRVGANRGDTAVVPEGLGEVNCANIVFARTPRRVARFIEAYCQSRDGRDQLLGLSTGSAQGVLNTKSVAGLRVPLAPLSEQDLLLERLLNAARVRRNIASAVESGSGRLDTLDQAILAKAFRGELVPQDPDDEPASVLLDRIKAERRPSGKSKR